MIAVLKNTATESQIRNLIEWFEKQGLRVNESKGDYCTVLGLIGDTTRIDIDLLSGLDIIENVTRISDPFKKANRKFHPEDTIVDVGGVKIGGGNFAVMAGPCSVESEEQIVETAKAVKAAGATLLRGGAFKPRTSPYDFQGLKEEGLKLLIKAREITGLPIVTEIMGADQLPLFKDIDCLQDIRDIYEKHLRPVSNTDAEGTDTSSDRCGSFTCNGQIESHKTDVDGCDRIRCRRT